ncbi:MAG: hypothetical protein GQ579_05540 [Bacteroidales bacterium]|nr:hypothetical protein [Bacteroidales bacterium]
MLSETKFQELYRRHQESRLTVRDFCSNEGIAPSTFYYWHKKIKKNNTIRDFIPLLVDPPQPVTPQSYVKSHAPVHDNKNIEDALLELVYPNGTKLRIKQDLDLAHLRTLVCLID